jgi:hypothetical protein
MEFEWREITVRYSLELPGYNPSGVTDEALRVTADLADLPASDRSFTL